MAIQRLILFDIDGTLARTQNGYVPFNEAISKTFGVAGDIRTVIPDGNTDPRIVEEIFTKGKIDIKIALEQWELFGINLHLSYASALQDGRTAIHALPGSLDLLSVLASKEDFNQGVVTGNFKVTARVKLEAAGLDSYLQFGAYGCDSPHRPDLPDIARNRWERLTGNCIPADQCIIIGDTPNDLEAARHNGMKCVLVGTGRYPLEELTYWQPDACLPDLMDTSWVVNTLLSL